ncbi:MAG: histidine phosphatase family protein [Hyphomicrobium sp. 32-62-53]|nr:MAG: histidine phosphatase family protein [Hyphomicrobium sp. 12-62-95]OYX99745.1 MAG: histidine phosphatase family protein [Hyphomicrobium sp. 32-62-53]
MRPALKLFFVRHGETDWNAERRYQGQTDIPLNDRGRAQSRRNGEALRAFLPTIESADFVASPLGRARETMEILRASLGLDPAAYRIDRRLIELSYGSWEGQLQTHLPQTDPYGLADRELDPFRWRPVGGESYADLLRRIIDWTETLERDTVIASHGGVSRCLRAHLLNLDPETIPALESPQDKVLVISNGEMSWV